MAETSRDYIIELEPADSVYLLFTLEDINFLEILDQKIDERMDTLAQKIDAYIDSATTITIRFDENISLKLSSFNAQQLNSKEEYQPGIGYRVESVSRETAIQSASELKPVEGAQNSPLNK